MKINIKQPLTFNEIGQKFNQKECIYPFAKKDCFLNFMRRYGKRMRQKFIFICN